MNCQIVPPFLLERLAKSADPDTRVWALAALAASAASRGRRAALAGQPARAVPSPGGKKHRLIYDARHRPEYDLPGKLVRKEGQKAGKDPAVNEAYDYSGTTYDFYASLFDRNSLDDQGMALISSVHLGKNFDNAFWNGEQMAYGDGDGRVFLRFTKALDVVGHELTHGVVTHSSNLDYAGEPGALNEHFADAFGSLIRQWRRQETVRQANWLIGAEILTAGPRRRALRSLAAPGTAYVNDPDLGTDPQPAYMRDLYRGEDDYGGVHINSGIPNHAFFLAAQKIGGRAWEKTGRIWYAALLALKPRSRFADAARVTTEKARALFGAAEEKAVRAAWKAVGL